MRRGALFSEDTLYIAYADVLAKSVHVPEEVETDEEHEPTDDELAVSGEKKSQQRSNTTLFVNEYETVCNLRQNKQERAPSSNASSRQRTIGSCTLRG